MQVNMRTFKAILDVGSGRSHKEEGLWVPESLLEMSFMTIRSPCLGVLHKWEISVCCVKPLEFWGLFVTVFFLPVNFYEFPDNFPIYSFIFSLQKLWVAVWEWHFTDENACPSLTSWWEDRNPF